MEIYRVKFTFIYCIENFEEWQVDTERDTLLLLKIFHHLFLCPHKLWNKISNSEQTIISYILVKSLFPIVFNVIQSQV